MEVGSARSESAQDRSLESTDVLAFAGNHGAARIRHFVDLTSEQTLRACQGEHGQPGDVEHRRFFLARIGDSDVERCLDRMVADIRRIVAGDAPLFESNAPLEEKFKRSRRTHRRD